MGKRMILAAAGALLPALAHGLPERRLPRGEEHPHFIESVYDSPVGEVQFTKVGPSGRSAFLRNAKGYLAGFFEVRGGAACGPWFLSEKREPLPAGCEFVFRDDLTGRFLSVRSEEMAETDLFQAARGGLRGREVGPGLGAGRPDVSL